MQLAMSDIGNYLDSSRAYLENAKNRLTQMGYCCPYTLLGDLMEEQDRLDRMYYQETQQNGLGYIWLILAAGSVAAYLGSYVYSHYIQAKTQSDYLDCLGKYQKLYEDSGFNPADSASMAISACGGSKGGEKEEITSTIKLAIYGSMAIFGLYILNKFISKKR